ncbi:hypothetical protein [Nocardia sp. BMG111209]|uniref:hypothetical protein n=1 Tax=Nocardia sp. BMG111209 TaxID=1160137 RepID=UPI00035E8794|nr:hypothetical protein [Nocardia sp. BMG111209]
MTAGAEYSVAAAAIHVGIETTIPDAEIDAFHRLYETAFGPLRTRAIARQVLYRNEFHEEMTDPRVQKHVARTTGGTPVGLSTLTRHLETVPWISPDYFAARFPLHAARGAIYYAGFTLVDPTARQGTAFHAMITSIVRILAAERAVVGWDICSYNNSRFSFADALRAALDEQADADVAVEDAQTYYAARFTGDYVDKGG